MKLLILGGTVYLGRAIARAALRRGHDVTCAARGSSGAPPEGAAFVQLDRSQTSNLEGTWDAVIDVARLPSHVRNAISALAGKVGHWSFVSTCSVYADNSATGQQVSTAPLVEAAAEDSDEADRSLYGPLKVVCERLVAETGVPYFIDRAGLIVGPEDLSSRFDYWVTRLARGGEVLAPGAPDEWSQWIDVRDLAAWHVHAAETGLTGIYDGIGTPVRRADFFAGIAAGVGADPALTWVDQDFLAAQEVQPWSGERSLPMWLPLPEYGGFMTRDTSPSLAAGLSPRPLAQTARDTLEWARAAQPAMNAGLTAEQESAVLAAWHASRS